MESGRRGITFALNQVEQVGFVPGLIGLPGADQVEASLTCFYALEAIAAVESLSRYEGGLYLSSRIGMSDAAKMSLRDSL